MTEVTVIIVNWNTCEFLREALFSLPPSSGSSRVETIVVDNGSTDDSLAMVASDFPGVRVVALGENLGFAKANNIGVQAASGEFCLLLNSDARLRPGAMSHLIAAAELDERAGILGAKLLNPDGSFQASHARFPSMKQELLILTGLGRLWFGDWYPSFPPERHEKLRTTDYVIGACLLVRRSAFLDLGGFDDGYFMYVEEVDLCYRMKQNGWKVWYVPEAEVVHLGGGSSKRIPETRELNLYRGRVKFFLKHYGRGPARRLIALLVVLTGIKRVVHRLVRSISADRWGRHVVSPRRLAVELRRLL